MTQAHDVLTLTEPQLDLDLIDLDEDFDDEDIELELEETSDSNDGKKTRRLASARRRDAARKKPYTEDSIRIYLQEIGRIRLLRAEEEIELARKIADLLKLERIREDFCLYSDAEWGKQVFLFERIERIIAEKSEKEPKLSDIKAYLGKTELTAPMVEEWLAKSKENMLYLCSKIFAWKLIDHCSPLLLT